MVRFSIAALLLAGSTFVSCSKITTNIVDPSVKVDYDASIDYFPDKVYPKSRETFTVQYHNSYKYVENKATNHSFILYQRGAPKPEPHDEKDTFFEVPVDKVATMITTSIPYIEMLGLRERIGLVASEEWVTSPCVLELVHDKKITDIPSDPVSSEFIDRIKKVWSTIGISFNDENIDSKSVVVDASEAPGALMRTEWLEFYATFFNLEKTANLVTQSIFNNYNHVKKNALKRAKEPKPVVAWAEFFSYNGTNYYEVSTATYKANLTADAGAAMIDISNIHVPQLKKYSTDKSFAYGTAEDIHKVLKNVDILVDESYLETTAPSFNDILKLYKLNESNTEFNFIKNKAIFREDLTQSKSGGSDWLSNGVIMADAALQDVVNMIYPGFHKDYEFHWMRNVSSVHDVNIVNYKECKNVSAPLSSFAYQSNSGNRMVASALSFILVFVAITLAF